MSTADDAAALRESARTLRAEADRLEAIASRMEGDEWSTIQEMFDDAGITYFTEDELRRASEEWPPPREYWSRVGDVMICAQELRERLGLPLYVSSFYRPFDGDSQHRWASAVDLNIVSEHQSAEQSDRMRMHALFMWRESPGEESDLAGCGVYGSHPYRIHFDTRHEQSKIKRYWTEEADPYLERLRNGEVPS